MRAFLPALLLAVAGCGSPPPQPPAAQAQAPAFDGAGAATRAALLAHGERLSRVLGCRGCHGDTLQGHRFYELYASNLTREVPRYNDAQLDRLIRHGERTNGRDLWAMPSEIFQYLGDPDFNALVAHLRTLQPAGGPTLPPLPLTAETRHLLQTGEFKPAAATVREARARTPPDLGPQHALGRYITMVTCAECHGPDLRGHPGDTPDLIVASAYDRAQFERLLTTGVPIGGRTLHLMGEVARERFAHMTLHERDALYAYLLARAAQSR